MNDFPGPSRGGDDQEFEEVLKGLPLDLGNGTPSPYLTGGEDEADYEDSLDMGYYALDAVPMFTNDDLDDGEMTRDETEAMLRLFTPEQLATGMIQLPGSTIKELAIRKMVRFAKVFTKMAQIREFLEEEGGDTDDDLLYSMLSVVGEMSRLRNLIPKLGYEMIETESSPEEEDDSSEVA